MFFLRDTKSPRNLEKEEKDKTIKRIKLANLGSMVAPNIHNFDPKWVKKTLAPSKNPQNGLYVFYKHKNKTLFPHIARRISEAAIGGARAGDLIFHLCGPVERKKPMTRTARVRVR